jgi:hypothetical protein
MENYRVAADDSAGTISSVGTWTIVDSTSEDHAPGDSVVWQGPAIANTQVTFTVARLISGAPQASVTGSTAFTVQARQWVRFDMPSALPPWQYNTGDSLAFRYPGIVVAALGSGTGDSFPDGGLGTNWHDIPITVRGPWALSGSGPNASVHYLKQRPDADPERVVIASSLAPTDPFYTKQDSTIAKVGEPPPVPATRYCVGTYIDSLRVQTLRHEGATSGYPTNHHTVAVQFYQDHDVMTLMEDLWAPLFDPTTNQRGLTL